MIFPTLEMPTSDLTISRSVSSLPVKNKLTMFISSTGQAKVEPHLATRSLLDLLQKISISDTLGLELLR